MNNTKDELKTTQASDKFYKAKKFNSKLFPIYKMFSWDLLFYYSVSFLFLTQTKGFSVSDILLADALYRIFKLIFQIPSVNIADTIGIRKSIVLGNILISISIFIVILTKNLSHIVISYALMGFGYAIKDLCDSILLRNSITNKEHPGTAFTNLDGRGSAFWYFLDSITAISCGFLFVFNNYLPMCLCLGMCTVSTLIAFSFKPYEDSNKKEKLEETRSYKTYFKDLKIAFRNIFKSRRLKALFLFSGTFAAILSLRSTVASSLFTEIGVKEEYFGIIFAVLTCISAISSKYQNIYHKKLKNRVLTYFSLIFSASFIIIGLTSIISNNYIFTLVIILLLYAIQYIIKGPYYTLLKRYLNSFSNSSLSTKIYSANTIVESLCSGIMCYLASRLLEFTSTKYGIAIIRMCVLPCIYMDS